MNARLNTVSRASTPVDTRKRELLSVIRFLYKKGWTPATSSNFSFRMEDAPKAFYVSASGLDKGELGPDDFIHINLHTGQVIHAPSPTAKPSAETGLHALIYETFPQASVVLHTHSVNATVISKLYEEDECLPITEFEILKAFEGIKTHETLIHVPIFSNSQNISDLVDEIREVIDDGEDRPPAFLLAGHGLYTWGKSLFDAKRHAEAFEFLFECILTLRAYGYADYS